MTDTQCPKPGHNGWLGKCLECARDEDFSPFSDATTPGFFLKPRTPAAPETPPYPENECPMCDAGEGTIKAPHSSIVGSPVVHHPSGMLCMKYMKPEHIAILKEAKAKREAETPRKEEA